MDTTDIKELLYRNYEHPRWDNVANRCLTCANCTMVCPTCFCSTVEDTTDLTGDHAERWRRWDSCFTTEFSQSRRRRGAQNGTLALSPVDDTQAGDMDRPVWHFGVCRLRTVHHVVPGGHRYH